LRKGGKVFAEPRIREVRWTMRYAVSGPPKGGWTGILREEVTVSN